MAISELLNSPLSRAKIVTGGASSCLQRCSGALYSNSAGESILIDSFHWGSATCLVKSLANLPYIPARLRSNSLGYSAAFRPLAGCAQLRANLSPFATKIDLYANT